MVFKQIAFKLHELQASTLHSNVAQGRYEDLKTTFPKICKVAFPSYPR